MTSDSMYETQRVAYRPLDGGLNTRKAQHDLARNELAALVNEWYAYGTALSKRPGTTALGAGATGDGVGITSVVTARFADNTYAIVQTADNNVYAAEYLTANAWTSIGSVTGGVLRGAQMYDPKTGNDTLFVVTGHDTPKMWIGSGLLSAVATGSDFLPFKPNTSTPITPAFVATLGNNSHLFYAGEPTAPSAVFISDAFAPESFTTPAMQADPYGYSGGGGTFLPAVIGMNDGVDGGAITGLQTMGFSMVTFKESAIYAMVQTQLLGSVAWQVYNVAAQRGALSPRSIIPFENFIAFLSIDGCYVTYGQPNEQMNKQKISVNVPSFFDSTRFGAAASIANRTTAVAVRIANRYVIWFDTGAGTPTTGVWFDFDVNADQQVPAAGQIANMNMGGAASASGPKDQGLFIWGDASVDRVGLFGVGFADFGAAIPISLLLKYDAFEDLFGPQAWIQNKVPSRADIVVEPLSSTSATDAVFTATLAADYGPALSSSLPLPVVPVNPAGGLWGDVWGAFDWSATGEVPSGYDILTMLPQNGVYGHILQIGLTETSTAPHVLAGIILEVNNHEVTR